MDIKQDRNKYEWWEFKMLELIEDSGLQEYTLDAFDAVCSHLTTQAGRWQSAVYTDSLLKALEAELQVASNRITDLIDAFRSEPGEDPVAVQEVSCRPMSRSCHLSKSRDSCAALSHLTNSGCHCGVSGGSHNTWRGLRGISEATRFRQRPTNVEVTQPVWGNLPMPFG